MLAKKMVYSREGWKKDSVFNRNKFAYRRVSVLSWEARLREQNFDFYF
jgi:hypothetical protein